MCTACGCFLDPDHHHHHHQVKGVVLGRLGEAVLAAPALSQPLTLTILAALSWSDSTASIKVPLPPQIPTTTTTTNTNQQPSPPPPPPQPPITYQACGLVDLVLPRLVEVGGLQGEDAARTIVALLQVRGGAEDG